MLKNQKTVNNSSNQIQLAQIKALAAALSYSLQPPLGLRTMVLSWKDITGEVTYYLPYANAVEIIKALLPYVENITVADYDNYHYNRDADRS